MLDRLLAELHLVVLVAGLGDSNWLALAAAGAVEAPSLAVAARVLRMRRRAKPAQMALSRVATPPTPSAKRAP